MSEIQGSGVRRCANSLVRSVIVLNFTSPVHWNLSKLAPILSKILPDRPIGRDGGQTTRFGKKNLFSFRILGDFF